MRQPPPPPPPPRKRPPQSSTDGGSSGGGGAGFGTVLLSIVLSAAATAGALQWQTLKDRFVKVPAASSVFHRLLDPLFRFISFGPHAQISRCFAIATMPLSIAAGPGG